MWNKREESIRNPTELPKQWSYIFVLYLGIFLDQEKFEIKFRGLTKVNDLLQKSYSIK